MNSELYTWDAWLNWTAWMMIAVYCGYLVGRTRTEILSRNANRHRLETNHT